MTCIVGVEYDGGVVLGADSCATSAGTVTSREDSKLWRVRQTVAKGRHRQQVELLFGLTGSPRMRQLMQWGVELPYRPQEMEPEEWLVTRLMDAVREALEGGGWLKKENERETTSGHWVLAYRGRLYHGQSDLQVGRTRPGYVANGSGRDVALGSLHTTGEVEVAATETAARRRVEAALRAAVEHNAYVAEPLVIETQEAPTDG